MIIFGTRGVTTTPEQGHFQCPTCASQQAYALKRVRRFFTLYFIPLIPLDSLGEYVECGTCRDSYNTAVLDYNPANDQQQMEAEYYTAIKKVMIYILLADGIIDDEEVKTTQQIYQDVSGKSISEQALLAEIDEVSKSQIPLSTYLTRLQGCLNDTGKEMVMTAAMHVALADGVFQDEEQVLIAKIGDELGMTRAHVQGVVSSVANG